MVSVGVYGACNGDNCTVVDFDFNGLLIIKLIYVVNENVWLIIDTFYELLFNLWSRKFFNMLIELNSYIIVHSLWIKLKKSWLVDSILYKKSKDEWRKFNCLKRLDICLMHHII